MAETPQELRYTKEHEYVKESDDDGVVIIGITDFAQSELGDIVYVDLPAPGATIASNEVFGTVEAVKAVSELFSPLSGEVVEINERLDQEPGLINSDPFGDGWMLKLRLSDEAELDSLLSADEYEAHTGG